MEQILNTTASRLEEIPVEIKFRLKRTVEDVIAVGKLLLEAKSLTADPECGVEGDNPDARFGRWVCKNFLHTEVPTEGRAIDQQFRQLHERRPNLW